MDITGVKPTQLKLINVDPITHRTVPISLKNLSTTLARVPLKAGDMLQLIESENVRAKPDPKKMKEKASDAQEKEKNAKKGPHMTFRAFVKASGVPAIPDYTTFLGHETNQRSISSYAPNIHWKLQRYRHLDIISFADPPALQKFYRNSFPELKQNLSRLGILFGRYVEDINPLVDQNKTDDLNREKKWDYDANGVRADVYAIYEPPQEAMENGARFITDPKQDVVRGIAEAMGLEPVGLIICKKKAKANPKGFQTLLTGKELMMLARLQSVFADGQGFSRFGCVVLEHAEMIEPVGLAASDTCVALESAGLLDATPKLPFNLRLKTPEGTKSSDMPRIYVPKESDESGGTNQSKDLVAPGDPFPTDFLLVKVIVAQSLQRQPLFRHLDFPVNGGIRELKSHVHRYPNEQFHEKFSDFNLLLNLPEMMGEDEAETVAEIARCIGMGEGFPSRITDKLDTWFVQKQLFS